MASHAAPESFKVALSGAQQVPAVETPGKGTADLTYDPATRMLTWSISYEGLSAPATMAHFHGPAAAGKNGPVTLWLSKQGSPPASPIKGEATLTPEQAAQFTAGEWYVNVHTRSHPGGEIRGQVDAAEKLIRPADRPHSTLTRTATASALTARRRLARTRLPMRGRGTSGGSIFRPVIIGVKQIVPLGDCVDRDRYDVQSDGRQQCVPENPVQGRDRVGDPRGNEFGERSLVGDVVGDVESAQRFAEQEREQEQHHPGAGRIVSDLMVGFAAECVLR